MSLPAADRDTAEQVVFDVGLYRIEAIKRAAYKFSASLACDIHVDATHVVCKLTTLTTLSSEDTARLIGEFKVEVLDQDLRMTIAEETAPLRAAILAYAFSRTGLQGE